MQGLLSLSRAIDRLLSGIAHIGAWCGFILMVVVCIDVVTRYFGVPKPFGMNSTQLQESEYWLHTFLFSMVLGYAYVRQAHVRIDLIRDRLPLKVKYLIEILGCLLFLIPYCGIVGELCWGYVSLSYSSGEASKSTIGLTHLWILKSSLLFMYGFLVLAGISQLIKSLAGFRGELPDQLVAGTLGGDL